MEQHRKGLKRIIRQTRNQEVTWTPQPPNKELLNEIPLGVSGGRVFWTNYKGRKLILLTNPDDTTTAHNVSPLSRRVGRTHITGGAPNSSAARMVVIDEKTNTIYEYPRLKMLDDLARLVEQMFSTKPAVTDKTEPAKKQPSPTPANQSSGEMDGWIALISEEE